MINYDIYVDPTWTYRQAVSNLKALRLQYREALASFSLWETKEWASFIRTTRDKFYTLNLLEWQIDNLWKYMNGYIPLISVQRSSLRYK